MRTLGLIIIFLGGWGASSAGAQVLEKTCVGPEGSDRGRALAFVVDARSRAHVLHINDNGGGLYYTVVDAIDGDENTVIDRRASVLGGASLTDTDLRLFNGVPHICYHDAPSDAFRVGWLDGEEWVLEEVDEGDRYGDACALFRVDGQLAVLYRRTNRLSMAVRQGANQWMISDVDNIGSVGHAVQLTELRNGFIVAAHRDQTTGNLRVSWRDPGGRWQNETVVSQNPAALRPRIVPAGDAQVRIFHGIQNVNSDGGLIVTQGRFGAMESTLLIQGEAGGSTGAALMSGRNLLMVTREKRRNAVLGMFDGLRIYRELPANANFEYLERWDANVPRHTLDFIDLAPDPFGMPVIALRDGPSMGVARLCFWRAADRDRDRMPDRVEAWAQTNPDDPDTDGDGRMDGDEAMAGDNPAGAGPIRPGILMEVGEPPMAPDMGQPSDAGLPPDAAPPPDAAEPTPDAAPVDASIADVAPADGAPPDASSVVDQGAVEDMEVTPPTGDAATPDGDVGPPDVDARRGPAPDAAPDVAPTAAPDDGGCDCDATAAPSPWWALVLLLGAPRRRRRGT